MVSRVSEGHASKRATLIREAFWLEWATAIWMVIEAAVAIVAGIMAGSISLLAFGIDSVIELVSAGVLMWRLTVELRYGQAFSESAERRATRIGGGFSRAATLGSCGGAFSVFCTCQQTHDYLPGMTIVQKVERLSGKVASQLRRRTMRS